MGAKIGYPDKILNITQLDQDYDGVSDLKSTFFWKYFIFACVMIFKIILNEIAGH